MRKPRQISKLYKLTIWPFLEGWTLYFKWRIKNYNMSSNDIGDWYRGIPKITKWWFTGSVIIPIAAKIGLLNPMWLFLHYESLIYKFQVYGSVTYANIGLVTNKQIVYCQSRRPQRSCIISTNLDTMIRLIYMISILIMYEECHIFIRYRLFYSLYAFGSRTVHPGFVRTGPGSVHPKSGSVHPDNYI